KKWMTDNAKMFVNVGAGVGKTKLINTRERPILKTTSCCTRLYRRNRMRRRQNHSKGTRISRFRNPLLKSWKSTHCREWPRTAGLRPAITPRVNKKCVSAIASVSRRGQVMASCASHKGHFEPATNKRCSQPSIMPVEQPAARSGDAVHRGEHAT